MVGLGSDKGEKWPKPEPESDLASGSRPKSGPNPSRKAVLGRGSFSHVFGPRALLSIFFCRYMHILCIQSARLSTQVLFCTFLKVFLTVLSLFAACVFCLVLFGFVLVLVIF